MGGLVESDGADETKGGGEGERGQCRADVVEGHLSYKRTDGDGRYEEGESCFDTPCEGGFFRVYG